MNAYRFTNYWYETSSGEKCAPPECGEDEIVVRYEDTGYHGGTYWAVVPANWRLEEAVEAYFAQAAINELRSIDGKGIPYSLLEQY